MLQRITAYLLITALLSANFTRLFIYAGYEMNKQYIAAKLCENRDRPWMHCNGKCYFMKKIKQAEDKQNAGEKQNQKNLFQEAAFNQPVNIRFNAVLLSVTKIPNYRIRLPLTEQTVFQPPRLS